MYNLNLEILNRIANGNTIMYMADTREETKTIEDPLAICTECGESSAYSELAPDFVCKSCMDEFYKGRDKCIS